MFFQNLARYGKKIALFEPELGRITTYTELAKLVEQAKENLGPSRQLVFLEMHRNRESVVEYLACLAGRHPVFLLPSLEGMNESLIENYRPNLLVQSTGDGTIHREQFCAEPIAMHEELALLLSTSGSTGNVKLVKLSARNIDANAKSIAEYLHLDFTERAITVLKFHYSYGLSVLHSHLAVGASLILTSQSVTDTAFWSQFNEYDGTSFAGVPYTYESLRQTNFNMRNYPTLRYCTQAGGKLEKHLIHYFNDMATLHFKQFYIMYGQTEAAPRISYLPPELTTQHPESIGIAVPGGTLKVLDESGSEIVTPGVIGELGYSGPNVMMGYSESTSDLATCETPSMLKTGDMGYYNHEGLFFLVGRTKRFVKPFGIRLNLDDVQSYVKQQALNFVVTGTDRVIIIAVEEGTKINEKELKAKVSARYNLPKSHFVFQYYETLPYLEDGKYDYMTILDDYSRLQQQERSAKQIVTSLIKKLADDTAEILLLKKKKWQNVEQLYRTVLDEPSITEAESLKSLSADSICFVEIAIEMERLFHNRLPENWPDMTIQELQQALDIIDFEEMSSMT